MSLWTWLHEWQCFFNSLQFTHGVFSPDAPQLIKDSPIDEVVVTNTIPNEEPRSQCSKIKTIDISILLAEAIRRIHNKESMAHLFRNVTVED